MPRRALTQPANGRIDVAGTRKAPAAKKAAPKKPAARKPAAAAKAAPARKAAAATKPAPARKAVPAKKAMAAKKAVAAKKAAPAKKTGAVMVFTQPSAGGGWEVLVAGKARASSRHATKVEAQAAGRERAMKLKAEHVIKTKDGKIAQKNSYGSDPRGRG
jgi:hypothetical protein